jgi:RNA polymerase sigma-70 factor (ECF subfamily)
MEAQLAELPMIDAPPDDGLAPGVPAPRPAAEQLAAVEFARARAGDPQAFRALMRLHQGRVFSVALRFTGRRAEAEELAQDVFVQLHGALAQIDSAAHLKHWLLRAISHRCIDRQRHEKRRPRLVPIDSVPESAEASGTDAQGDPLAGARLRRLLLDLAPDARAVMLLRFQEDLDPGDIATALNMSVNTVKSHLRRSIEWLRAQYAGEEHGY